MPRFLLSVADFARANATEFHLCEHDGIFAAVAKFINQTSGLQRKFIMLNSTKAKLMRYKCEIQAKILNLVAKFRTPKS